MEKMETRMKDGNAAKLKKEEKKKMKELKMEKMETRMKVAMQRN